jgi:hypothetical protein
MSRSRTLFLLSVALMIVPLAATCVAQDESNMTLKQINETIFQMTIKSAKTPLDVKAAYRWTMLDTWYSMPDQPGSGPYPATYAPAPDGHQFVVFQPKDLAAATAKRKLGVYVWGTGGCSADANSARFHLTEIASNGYIAISPGQILTGPHANGMSLEKADNDPASVNTAAKMLAALDWILTENKRQGSPYFGLIDPNRIAVAGNSCGGLLAIKVALDPRVKLLIFENSGIFDVPPTMVSSNSKVTKPGSDKADLAKLHTPVLYIVGGPQDVAEAYAMDNLKLINQVPVFVADQPGAGHVGLFLEPNGEATQIELDWLKWRFDGDQAAAKHFVGPDCTLCRNYRWAVYRKGIE